MNWSVIVNELFEKSCISHLSYEIFNMMKFELGEDFAFLLLITNHELENGHSCFVPREFEKKKGHEYFGIHLDNDFQFPDIKEIDKLLNALSTFSESLFVYNYGKFFFKRVYNYEKAVVERLKELAEFKELTQKESYLELSFWQNVAVKMALSKKLLVISGGPGTGKTTVIKAIINQLLQKDENLQVVVTAPTGKAVSRIASSFDDIENVPPPITIHRLLKAGKLSRGFYHDENNKLPYDVVVVDEMSMVSLELMYSLLKALKDNSRLILLGDKDQLASVEAGAVMGEICSYCEKKEYGKINVFSENFGKFLNLSDEFLIKKCDKMIDSVIEFQENFRFDKNSGIGVFAEAIRNYDSDKINKIVMGDIKLDGLEFLEDIDEKLFDKIAEEYIENFDENRLSDYLLKTKVLTPLKISLLGSDRINLYIENKIKRKKLISKKWYDGRQVLIKVNDYFNNLFNGDIGVYSDGKVFFPKRGDNDILIEPDLLPLHEPAFAMTVHKSQGSEFDNVYFIFGRDDLPLLTRELIYTAITRAKKKVFLIGSKKLLLDSLKRKTVRKSAISDLLYG